MPRRTALLALFMGLALLLCAGAAKAQTLVTRTIDLAIPSQGTQYARLPNWWDAVTFFQTRGLARPRVTIGDLNGDDIPDVVLNNGVGFLRVCYLNASRQVYLAQDIIAYGDTTQFAEALCTATGDGARYRTVSDWGTDGPLIYDIDLDGKNELIYLQFVAQGENPNG